MGPYVVLEYGQARIRVEPILFEPVVGEGFELGQWVEVRARLGRNEPHTGLIREMRWDDRGRRILYFLKITGSDHSQAYTADDLKHVEPIPAFPTERAEIREPRVDADEAIELE
jgi:hypothetical protein